MQMSDASYVNELTPEEVMPRLRFYGEKIWEKIVNKVRKRELVGPSWVWIYDAIERLEHGPEPETLIELIEPTEYERNEIYQLWSKLSERQREKVIRDITRDLASRGLEKFLHAVAEAISTLITTIEDIRERRRALKDALSKADQFMSGEISFDELMSAMTELPSVYGRGRYSFDELMSASTELLSLWIDTRDRKLRRDVGLFFKKGVALSKYLTRTELKTLVDKILIRELDKELSKYPEPYW